MEIIKETISESQQVAFFIDGNEKLQGLKEISLNRFDKAIVFCDENLSNSWWPLIEDKIRKKVNIVDIKFLKANEETKSLSNYSFLVDHLGTLKCSKSDLIICVGGGSILDAISYLASTYMRGVPLMMIPTTLVGQADASTAGKTCINTSYAKNALGTLYLPHIVYSNVCILQSVSIYELRQGFSEIFKYGLLGSNELINLMVDFKVKPSNELMMSILKETIRVRIDIRKKDPLASNLGHTFGHALEKISNFEVNHGDAISVGTVMALEFSSQEGIISSSFKEEVINLMKQLKLNTKVSEGLSPKELANIMLTDKKSTNSEIRLVLIEKIAKPYLFNESYFYPCKPERIVDFLEGFFSSENYVNKNHWSKLRKHEI